MADPETRRPSPKWTTPHADGEPLPSAARLRGSKRLVPRGAVLRVTLGGLAGPVERPLGCSRWARTVRTLSPLSEQPVAGLMRSPYAVVPMGRKKPPSRWSRSHGRRAERVPNPCRTPPTCPGFSRPVQAWCRNLRGPLIRPSCQRRVPPRQCRRLGEQPTAPIVKCALARPRIVPERTSMIVDCPATMTRSMWT